jgi:tricorn protease
MHGSIRRTIAPLIHGAVLLLFVATSADAQGTRLLRQPTLSATHIAFEYGGDLWVVNRSGGEARRLTSTPAAESNPYFSPDGKWIAFTSERTGFPSVYVVSADGGDARRLTWNPASTEARGWTPDGKQVLVASERGTAPVTYNRLWTVPVDGGPATMVPAPMGMRGSYSADGRQLVVDRVSRWDSEFRNYRGGQNTPLTVLDLGTLAEVRLPNERTTDISPVWLGETIYFLSDRDFASNVWAYDVKSRSLRQITHVKDADIKSLAGGAGQLVYEQDGWIHTLDPATGESRVISIEVRGDFPWISPRWVDVSKTVASAALSATGKRALFESRGEIFTVPTEKGDARNLTRSSGAADRAPVWSPDGKQIAWFSDSGSGYRLLIESQDGLTPPKEIAIGDAKMAWAPAWSPDGKRIAFVDDHARLRVLEVASGRLTVADVDGALQNRASMAPAWSPDSKWLAYAKLYPNQFRRIHVWNVASGATQALTDGLADVASPAWDRNGKYLYFLASTDLGMTSGWADVSSITRRSTYGAYVMVLSAKDSTPYLPESDEEGVSGAKPPTPLVPGTPIDTAKATPRLRNEPPAATRAASPDSAAKGSSAVPAVSIDFDRIDRRILALPVPTRDYTKLVAGPSGVVFIAERVPNQPGATLHRFSLSKRKAEVFATSAQLASASGDGKRLLYRQGEQWFVVGTEAPPKPGDGSIQVKLQARLDPSPEWRQIFEEAWRLERDYFYAPNHHGNDWDAVHARYAPLVPWVRHRADLTFVLDMLGGELSVGHSFTGGGDLPSVDTVRTGLLGADFAADGAYWRLSRIFTSESWNPELRAPLDAPGVKAATGNYILAINGERLTTRDDPYRLLEGTADRQTVLQLNDRPDERGSWTVTVVPVLSEDALRTRAWVEDNRRMVASLSRGRLAYAWIPNTGRGAVVNFDRYFYSQQDKDGAVIDERWNQGGNLDDYMVMLMGRRLLGGITNDVPGSTPFKIPVGGVVGPKVLLTNEMAGSGGDYFPWAFRQLQVGPLIGTRTWGGLVAACVPYALVDGGYITSPCSAVYDKDSHWVAENEGVAPDTEVLQEAKAVAAGRDPQLERGVEEALKLLATRGEKRPAPPPFPVKARRP